MSSIPLSYKRTSELRRCYPRDSLVRRCYPTRFRLAIPRRTFSRLINPVKSRCSPRCLVALRPFRRHPQTQEHLNLRRKSIRFLVGPRRLRIQSGQRGQKRAEAHTPFRKVKNENENNTWYTLVTLRASLPQSPVAATGISRCTLELTHCSSHWQRSSTIEMS